jgi:hypothetical protein
MADAQSPRATAASAAPNWSRMELVIAVINGARRTALQLGRALWNSPCQASACYYYLPINDQKRSRLMKHAAFGIAAMALTLSTIATAQPSPTVQPNLPAGPIAAAPPAAPAAEPAATEEDQRIRCRRTAITGSLSRTARVCMTVAEWRRANRNGNRNARDVVDNANRCGGGAACRSEPSP